MRWKFLLALVASTTVIILATFVLVIAGALPIPHRLGYLSFEKANAVSVIKVGKLSVDHLWFDSIVPIEYRLRRDQYDIHIRIDSHSYTPAASIHIGGPGNPIIMQRSSAGTRTERARSCSSFSHSPDRPKELYFQWVICGTNSDKSDRVIELDVIDSNGKIIGEESLSFDLQVGGIYWMTDSL